MVDECPGAGQMSRANESLFGRTWATVPGVQVCSHSLYQRQTSEPGTHNLMLSTQYKIAILFSLSDC